MNYSQPRHQCPGNMQTQTGEAYRINQINRKLKVFRTKFKIQIKHSPPYIPENLRSICLRVLGRSAEALILLNTIFKHADLQTTKRYIGLVQTI